MSGVVPPASFADAAAHLHTVRDLLRFAVSRFQEAGLSFGHGSDNAYDEAAYLILHTLHLPLQRLEPLLDAALLPGEIRDVLSVLERRVTERRPAAYITGEAWLGDYRFHVDERVIVPRSHIAELIDEGFSAWLPDPEAVTDALDLCTGSGCLAILLALAFPAARVDAVDLSAEALQVARVNVEDYRLEDRVMPVQSDLFAGLAGRRYQLIVSNPPYVDAKSMQDLPPEYRHEPALALAAGADGMEVVRRILAQAHRHLLPGGILVAEIGSGRAAFEAAFPGVEPTWLSTRAGDDLVFLLERGQLL
ncbi:MAG TPA: 50S ribosomal protein L3 N(5)-glutamine methyltransferase [Burkholderiales bacterium]|nr:50S ribosomal protein L3 N(5)-glutamine methyltransferase [Burkholderiales bacterium]